MVATSEAVTRLVEYLRSATQYDSALCRLLRHPTKSITEKYATITVRSIIA
jgi:hypothetical protein